MNYTYFIEDAKKINKTIKAFIADLNKALGFNENEIEYKYKKEKGSFVYSLKMARKDIFIAMTHDKPIDFDYYMKWFRYRINDVATNEQIKGYAWQEMAETINKYFIAKDLNDVLTEQLSNNKKEVKRINKI